MRSVLNKDISCFANYRGTQPTTVNLLTWLTSEEYADQVKQIRSTTNAEERGKLKAGLPAITPSGLFSKRAESCLVNHSGLLAFDIDHKDNTHIPEQDYHQLGFHLRNLVYVAYCGRSVSGMGYWGLVPIANPARHKEHFAALEEAFAEWGIVIDPACKDVSRLRGYSWDPDAYFNHQAAIFVRLREQPKQERQMPLKRAVMAANLTSDQTIDPWDDFNAKHHIVDLLTGYGWTFVREDSQRIYLRRPGHTTAKYSGNYHKEKNLFLCKSSSTPLPIEKGLTACAIYTYYEHGGNFSESISHLRMRGYGGKPNCARHQLKPSWQEPKLQQSFAKPLPHGFTIESGLLVVDGTPIDWIEGEALEDARQRMKGYDQATTMVLNQKARG